MNYAGPDWPVIITVSVIVILAAATVVLTSRLIRAARQEGQRRPGAQALRIIALVVAVIGLVWVTFSLIANLAFAVH